MSFTRIKQGPQELYTSFIDRRREAVTKQVSSVEAQNALALKLAVENANADCKKLLMALPGDAGLVDVVEARNKTGTTSFQMTAFAEAFAVALRGDKKCYNCGRPGHLKKSTMSVERETEAKSFAVSTTSCNPSSGSCRVPEGCPGGWRLNATRAALRHRLRREPASRGRPTTARTPRGRPARPPGARTAGAPQPARARR